MVQIDEKILESILNEKFNSLVGLTCERIENLEKRGLSFDFSKQIKFDLKKDAYNTMREIKSQMNTFSQAVKIVVDLIRPASK